MSSPSRARREQGRSAALAAACVGAAIVLIVLFANSLQDALLDAVGFAGVVVGALVAARRG
jgi:hypothetical protein